MVDLPRTYGALLTGGLIAFFLSGAVALQSFFYFKFYPLDCPRIKVLVAAVCSLDLLHTGLVAVTLWYYLIAYFGNAKQLDHIPWSLPITIALTAALTFLVHCFFADRVHKLSRQKWYLTIPIISLAALRFGAAALSTAQMMRIRTLSGFVKHFGWVFTLGLGLSSTVDILIAFFLCYFLLKSRKESSNNMHQAIDTLILYTFETGALTCAGTIISMICWLLMPHNLIFMGLHLLISKIYANSLLAVLNTRKSVRGDKVFATTVASSMNFSGQRMLPPESPLSLSLFTPTQSRTGSVQVNVEQTVEVEVDSPSYYMHKRAPSTPRSSETLGRAL